MKTGQAGLGVWNDIVAEHESAFNDWYQQEHIPERLGLPGFIDVRRGMALGAGARYCALYTLDSIEALRSPAYLERLAQPTPRTRAIMAHFRNMNRSACAITLSSGRGAGGVLGTLALTPAAGRERELRAALEKGPLDELARAPGVLRVQLWEADRALSNVSTAEQSLRPQPDAAFDWIVVTDQLHADEALAARVPEAIRATGLAARVEALRAYRLLCHCG